MCIAKNNRDNPNRNLIKTADSVPMGMLLKGFFRSPDILTPAIIPVAVGKNTPNTVKNVSPGWRER